MTIILELPGNMSRTKIDDVDKIKRDVHYGQREETILIMSGGGAREYKKSDIITMVVIP